MQNSAADKTTEFSVKGTVLGKEADSKEERKEYEGSHFDMHLLS